MSTDRKIFAVIVWIGVIANWTFGVWAVFFNPHSLLTSLELGDVPSAIWLYNYSILLMILSLFYIPAALDPFRYRANAWLLIVGRLVPASTFFVGVALTFLPSGFLRLGLGDATFGILELIFLVRTFRAAAAIGTKPVPA
jgi:hypothetical protein